MNYNSRHWQARGSLGDAIFKLSQEDPRDNAGKIRRLQELYGELAKAKEIAMRRDEYNWGEDEDYEAKLETIEKETRPYIDDYDDDSSSSFSPGPSLRASDLRRSPSSSSSSSSSSSFTPPDPTGRLDFASSERAVEPQPGTVRRTRGGKKHKMRKKTKKNRKRTKKTKKHKKRSKKGKTRKH